MTFPRLVTRTLVRALLRVQKRSVENASNIYIVPISYVGSLYFTFDRSFFVFSLEDVSGLHT
jgi:hypothetical protein